MTLPCDLFLIKRRIKKTKTDVKDGRENGHNTLWPKGDDLPSAEQ